MAMLSCVREETFFGVLLGLLKLSVRLCLLGLWGWWDRLPNILASNLRLLPDELESFAQDHD